MEFQIVSDGIEPDYGADFVCLGMYDFQVVEDCNIVLDSLANVTRVRPWRG